MKIYFIDLVVLNKNDNKKYISVDEIRNLKKLYKTSLAADTE